MKLIDMFDYVFDEVTDIDIIIDNLILYRHYDILNAAVSWSNDNG